MRYKSFSLVQTKNGDCFTVRSFTLGPDCTKISPVQSGLASLIVRGSYVGVDPAITECLPGMLCAEVTQSFRSLVAGGLIYYMEYRVSVDVNHIDIDRVVEDGVLVCS